METYRLTIATDVLTKISTNIISHFPSCHFGCAKFGPMLELYWSFYSFCQHLIVATGQAMRHVVRGQRACPLCVRQVSTHKKRFV